MNVIILCATVLTTLAAVLNIDNLSIFKSETDLLNANATTTINASTTFSNAATTTSFLITARIGSTLQFMSLPDNNFPSGTVVTFKPAGCTTTMPGNIFFKGFYPTRTELIPICATTGPQTGTINYTATASGVNYNLSTNVNTNFVASTSTAPILGRSTLSSVYGSLVGVRKAFSSLPLVNFTGETQVAHNTTAEFVPAGCQLGNVATISGTIQTNRPATLNSTFVPNADETLPTCAILTDTSDSLYSAGQVAAFSTDFEDAASTTSSTYSSYFIYNRNLFYNSHYFIYSNYSF